MVRPNKVDTGRRIGHPIAWWRKGLWIAWGLMPLTGLAADDVNDRQEPTLAEVASRLEALETAQKKSVWISGYTQMVYVADPSSSANESFGVKRARLSFAGTLTGYAKFRLQPDFASIAAATGGGSVAFREAWIEVIADADWATFRIGQYHQPFGYETTYSSSSKKLADNPMYLSSVLTADYDYGIQWWGHWPGAMKDGLKWRVAVMNGTGSTTETNVQKDFGARVSSKPIGELECGVDVYLRQAGAAGTAGTSYAVWAKMEAASPFPWYVTGEYVSGKDSTPAKIVQDIIATLEIKPFVGMGLLSELAPTIRYESWDPDTSAAASSSSIERQHTTVGLNFYPDKSIRFLVDFAMKAETTNLANDRWNWMLQVKY